MTQHEKVPNLLRMENRLSWENQTGLCFEHMIAFQFAPVCNELHSCCMLLFARWKVKEFYEESDSQCTQTIACGATKGEKMHRLQMDSKEEWSNIIELIKNFKRMLRQEETRSRKISLPCWTWLVELFLDYAHMLIKFDLDDIWVQEISSWM